jgi:alpha-L-arabinofuranosidase
MYANELEERVVPLKLETDQRNEQLDGIATTDATGKRWAIALTNREASEIVACAVKLGDRMLDGDFEATTLAGDSPDAFNDVHKPDRVVPRKTKLKFDKGVVNLPPHSLTIVHVH